MTIADAGTPSRWYFQLKKEWADAHAEGRAFQNPILKTILRWKS